MNVIEMNNPRIWTAIELGKEYKLHPDTIRKMFMDEPGVICLGKRKRSKRPYCTLRIPDEVRCRVFARVTVK
jgi:hypothetical protein